MRNIVNKFHESSIKFNPRFASGFARQDVARGLRYVDDVMGCAQQSFPEGLLYESLEVCTPEKAFDVFTTLYKGDKKYIYDFARNDFYLAQLNFSYEQTPFSLYLYMPFTTDAGMIYIRDKPFYIKPVMADPLISVSGEGLFLPLNQTRMTTRARAHFVLKDERLLQVKVHETTIHHSLNTAQKVDNKEARMRITCNGHYLFVKDNGYKGSFLRFNATAQAGFEDTVNTTNYPKEDWVIYKSTIAQNPEPQLSEDGVFREHGVCLAIKRSDVTKEVESLVGAFFYVLDVLPEVEDIAYLDDYAWWAVKMGQIILGSSENHKILMRKMGFHYKTIDTYIDPMAINLMQDNHIYVSDIYGYLEWGISNFDSYRNRPEANQATMYGKYLLVNSYVFKPVREAIFNAIYELRQKKSEKPTFREIQMKLRSRLKPDLITKINSNCPNVTAVTSSTDSRLLKMGLEIVPQDNMRTEKTKQTPKMLRNVKWQWDPSYIDVGGFASMSKKEPVGKDYGNPAMNLGLDGRLQPQAEDSEIIDKVRRMTRID